MNKKSLIANVVLFGALWGLLEASLGYALQFLPPLFSGSIMFPIGAMLMYWAYRNTDNKASIVYVALIAASIKAINFLMPGLPPIKTYNPMISIMLQSLVMVVIVSLISRNRPAYGFLGIGILAVLWRTLFIVNITINHALTGFPFPQLVSPQSILSFIFLYGALETLFLSIAYGIKLLLNKKINLVFKPHLAISLATYVAAALLVLIPII
ncbi:MAG TPA: hypothetical protein PK340_04130 [Bacilli bacterium]|nr:hypothetical protein [Bacilli bacterium]